MSDAEDRIDQLRSVFAGWAKGDFSVSRPLLAEDIVCTWDEPPSVITCHGIAEMAARFTEFLGNWSFLRAEAQEFVVLDDDTILTPIRQYSVGKSSGAETDAQAFVAFRFDGDRLTRVHWRFDRDDAIEDLTGPLRHPDR